MRVFGVSAKSMQCSYDDRGNSVPIILLMMQKRLYSEGGLKVCSVSLSVICLNYLNNYFFLKLLRFNFHGCNILKAEGIFRINPENSQEELVRNQLNKGVVPHGIDVHCLSGLIKVR